MNRWRREKKNMKDYYSEHYQHGGGGENETKSRDAEQDDKWE